LGKSQATLEAGKRRGGLLEGRERGPTHLGTEKKCHPGNELEVPAWSHRGKEKGDLDLGGADEGAADAFEREQEKRKRQQKSLSRRGSEQGMQPAQR